MLEQEILMIRFGLIMLLVSLKMLLGRVFRFIIWWDFYSMVWVVVLLGS